ncbi:MAG: esterase-like activity of phytase family protein [Paracoccaceae bacterium]
MRRSAFLVSATLATAALVSPPALGEETFPARLAGTAVLPAASFVPPPAGAPADAAIPGKFTGSSRNMEPESVMGDTGAAMHGKRPTGIKLPFRGQALQGFSGYAMNRTADGSFWMITDNGFGSKLNSPDALLMVHRMVPRWDNGRMEIAQTIFLRDPDFQIPFRIAHEGTPARYLTGADFDVESIQALNGELWIGDEFGPYLIRLTEDGKVIAVYPTKLGDKDLKSPDTPGISAVSVVGKDWQVPRSAGYEGMALQPGTGLLWAMLEKPLLGEDNKPEGNFVHVIAFDPAKGEWTGQSFKFALGEGTVSIGDFNFIDATRALVLERDNGEGDPSLKCEGDPKPDCFPLPAITKRVVLIDTATVDADGFVRRIGSVDLMAIADPDGKGTLETVAKRDLKGIFTFPFFTIEDVVKVDDTHIMVGNDNNLPFSSGRALDRAADNEAILLSVPELLAAK